MSYKLEQKREALAHKQLWWRYPNDAGNYAKSWSLVTDDLKEICHQDLEDGEAEYHIGPTPPRVLSKLEGELLEALKDVIAVFDSNPSSIVDTVWVTGNRPETLYDLCLAAIQKAESTS